MILGLKGDKLQGFGKEEEGKTPSRPQVVSKRSRQVLNVIFRSYLLLEGRVAIDIGQWRNSWVVDFVPYIL